VNKRLLELENTIDERTAAQKVTAATLWPFFENAKDARESLSEYFRYLRRAFVAQRNMQFAQQEEQEAKKSQEENDAKAKPHLNIVLAHLEGNTRAKELLASLQQQREALWSAAHLQLIKKKQKAALEASIIHLSARIAAGEVHPTEQDELHNL
jgi:hypothetical protein